MTHISYLRIPGYSKVIDLQLIGWLESDGNYTLFHLRDAPKPFIVSYTLKHFEIQLPDFIRASKSSLINPNYIDKVIQESTKVMRLELIDGSHISVSRRRIQDVLSRLESYPELAS